MLKNDNKFKNKSAMYFLKVCPKTLDQDYGITENYFYNNLYYESDNAKAYIEDIIKTHDEEGRRVYFIVGYKGCGKSTFTNNISYKINGKKVYIPFDRNKSTIKGEMIRNPLLAYIKNSILEDKKNNYKVSKRFFSKYYSSNVREKFIDPAYEAVANLFQLIFEWSASENKNFLHFYEQLKHLSIENLLLVLYLWVIAKNNMPINGKPLVLLFDNIDAIDDPEDLDLFIKGLFAFTTNIKWLIQNVFPRKIGNSFNNSYIIVSMRETTFTKVGEKIRGEHFADRALDLWGFYDISNCYSVSEIINHRVKFVETLDIDTKIKTDLYNISEIANNNEILPISEISNYDYRTSVNLLKSCFDAYKNTLEFKDKELKIKNYCLRGIVYRDIFELYNNEGYFTNLRNTEYIKFNDTKCRINISRLVLEYLANNEILDYTFKNKYHSYVDTSSLKTLKNAFEYICDSKTLAKAIYGMYNLRNEKYWNHLVTFDGVENLDYNSIEEALTGESNSNIRIRITPAGKQYLAVVVRHFEYSSIRCPQNDTALFLCTEKCDDGTYKFEKVITSVIKEVRNRCRVIKEFYEKVVCHNNKEDEFNRNFLFRVTSGNVKYHGELIINEHINYIDSFRRFMCSKLANNCKEQQKVNDILIDKIIDYMVILGFKEPSVMNKSRSTFTTLVTPQSKILCDDYWQCIKTIKMTKQYNLAIERKR